MTPAWTQNSSFSESGYQVYWDSTSLGLLKTCPRKYQLAIRKGVSSPEPSPDLTWGILIHEASEKYHHARASGADHEEALRSALHHVFMTSYVEELTDGREPKKSRDTLLRAVVWYLDSQQDDALETVILENGKPATELSFTMDLPGAVAPDGSQYRLCGHIDRLVRFDGDIYVADIKSTKSTLNNRFFEKWNPGNQMCQPGNTMVETAKGEVPLRDVKPGDEVFSYHRKQKNLVKREVLSKAARFYEGDMICIRTEFGEHEVTPNHRVIVRYKEEASKKYAIYVMRKNDKYRIGFCQMKGAGTQKNGVSQRCRAENADAIWVLDLCDSRDDAYTREQLLALWYSIPQALFASPRHKDENVRLRTQRKLDEFWELVGNNKANAEKIIEDFGRDINYPFYNHRRQKCFSTKRAYMVEACNLLEGFIMVPVKTKDNTTEWVDAQISRNYFSGTVYSLDVYKPEPHIDTEGTYVANGIVTGNSLYTVASWVHYGEDAEGVMIDAVQCAKGFNHFMRGKARRHKPQLEEWLQDTIWWIKQAESLAEMRGDEPWPQNDTMCNVYRPCPYKAICTERPEHRGSLVDMEYETKVWDPAKSREV